MSIWQAIVLGLVQGLTEFIPVSSSGHLTLLQQLFGIEEGFFFSILLHGGTLVAVCFVFWKDILALFKKPYKTLLYLVIATIPGAVVGLLLDDWIESVFYSGKWLFICFFITAVILLAAELYAKHLKKINKETLPISIKSASIMGVAQVFAMLPGISRSGSTIVAGTLSGAKNEEVSRFSFMMSIPMILGSLVVQIAKLVLKKESIDIQFDAQTVIALVLGVSVAALSGLFAIKVMLKLIAKAEYKWFSLYLVLLSIACLVLTCLGFFG